MAIQLTCTCGKQLRARDEAVGKQAKCPACGTVIQVKASEPPLEDLIAELPEQSPAATSNSPLRSTNPHRDAENRQLAVRLVVGATAVCGLGLVALLVWAILPSGDARAPQANFNPPAEEEESPSNEPPQGGTDRERLVDDRTNDTATASVPGNSGAAANSDSVEPVIANDPPDLGPPPDVQLPHAMTAPPAWLASDSSVPFDLDEFFHTPPPKENAAPYYLEVLFAIDPLLADDVYGDARAAEMRAATGPRDQNLEQLMDQYYQWKENPRAAPPSAPAQIDDVLVQFHDDLEKLRAVQSIPDCVFACDMSYFGPNPHVHAARTAAQLLRLSGERAVELGDFSGALARMDSMLRLSRDLQRRGASIMQLAAGSMEASALVNPLDEGGLLHAILQVPSLTAADCDQVWAALANHEAKRIDPFMESNKADYIAARMVIHDLQTGAYAQVLKKYEWQPPHDSPWQYLMNITSLDVSPRPLLKTHLDDLAQRGARKSELNRALKSMGDDDFAHEIEALNKCHTAIQELGDKSYLERLQPLFGVSEPLRNTQVAIFLEPRTDERYHHGHMRAAAHRAAARCLVAVRRWEIEHGQWPEKLAVAVGEAGMDHVPLDPFSEAPMRVTTIGGRLVIYSIGPDGDDDGAVIEWNGRSDEGDLVYTVPPRR